MNEKTRQERQQKLLNSIKASAGHLKRGLATLEDANLYSTDEQEHDIDTFATRLDDILTEMQDIFEFIAD